MNSTIDMVFANAQTTAIIPRQQAVQELSLRIARQQRKVLRTVGQEQDQALDKLIALYRERAAAFDRGAA